ncbi:MAG: hypothetical protein ACLQIB_10205 [Isosphaeraceae bacterium]
MAESFKLTTDHTQKATLGCGTLILIAIIVAIFSDHGTRDVERGLDNLRNEVRDLKQSIDSQSDKIRGLEELLKKPDSGSKPAEAPIKN